jgi:hypothetical protein
MLKMQRKNLFLVGEFLRSKIHEGKLEQTGLTKPARRYRIVAERISLVCVVPLVHKDSVYRLSRIQSPFN